MTRGEKIVAVSCGIVVLSTISNFALYFSVPRSEVDALARGINARPTVECALAHAAVETLLADNDHGGITPAKLRAALHAVAGCK